MIVPNLPYDDRCVESSLPSRTAQLKHCVWDSISYERRLSDLRGTAVRFEIDAQTAERARVMMDAKFLKLALAVVQPRS